MTPFYTPISKTNQRVYISGPMTGMPNSNLTNFERVAFFFRESGFSVCNPVETSIILGKLDHSDYMRFDFARILEADLVVALVGWSNSPGALVEIHMALSMGTAVKTEANLRLTMTDLTAAISADLTAAISG